MFSNKNQVEAGFKGHPIESICTQLEPYGPIWTHFDPFGSIWTRDVARLKSLQNWGAFRELFWVLLTKTENFCANLKKNGSFLGAFLGAFDKNGKVLCYI